MVILEKTSLLKGWVWLFLKFQETTDNATNIFDVVTVLCLVEEELIFKQSMLLLENCDFRETSREDLERSLNDFIMVITQLGVVVVLNDSPDLGFWLDDSLHLHNTLEDVHSFITSIIESLDSHEQLDHIGWSDVLVMGKQDMVADVWADHVVDQNLNCGFRFLI